MKRYRRYASRLLILIMALTFTCSSFTISAYGITNSDSIFRWQEDHEDSGTYEKAFTIENDGILYLDMEGFYAEGRFTLMLKTDDGTLIYKKEYKRNDYCEETISMDLDAGNYVLSFTSNSCLEIEVNGYLDTRLSYKRLIKEAKKYSTKNIPYKTITAGQHARLSGKSYKVGLEKKSYIMTASAQPYIDITRTGDLGKVRLAMKGKTSIVSYGRRTFYPKAVWFTGGGMTTGYNAYLTSDSGEEDYTTNIYQDYKYWKIDLANYKDKDTVQLDKLIKIFKQKTVKVEIVGKKDSYITWKLSDFARKNWLAVFNKYKKLLELY